MEANRLLSLNLWNKFFDKSYRPWEMPHSHAITRVDYRNLPDSGETRLLRLHTRLSSSFRMKSFKSSAIEMNGKFKGSNLKKIIFNLFRVLLITEIKELKLISIHSYMKSKLPNGFMSRVMQTCTARKERDWHLYIKFQPFRGFKSGGGSLIPLWI